METTETSSWLKRSAIALEHGGPIHLLLKVLRRFTHQWLDFGGVCFFRGDLNWPPAPQANVDVFFATEEDTRRLIRELQSGRTESDFNSRFANGDCCVAASLPGGDIVHAHWFSRRQGNIVEIGRRLPLRANQVYFYDSYTVPRMRGHGVERSAAQFTFAWLKRQGVTHSYCYSRSDNPRRLKGLGKLEQFIGSIWFIRFRSFRPLVLPFGRRKIALPLERIAAPAVSGGQRVPSRATSTTTR